MHGEHIIMLSYVIYFVSQILHITIIKTVKFVGGGKKRVLMAHRAFHFSNHMATAFRDVLFILFQLSYFSDSKTPLLHHLWNQMHLIIHGSLQLLLTQQVDVIQLSLMSSQVRHMVTTSYVEFNYSSKLLRKIKLLFKIQRKLLHRNQTACYISLANTSNRHKIANTSK